MSKEQFHEYLSENYHWWMSNFYKNEDARFFNFFVGVVIQEMMGLKKEWENPAIDLEVTLDRIIAFFMKHLVCDSPKQTFLILMHILASKCFNVCRKKFSTKWRKKIEWKKKPDEHVIKFGKNLRIQAFFFKILTDFFISNPSLKQEIPNFQENDARLFSSIIEGFKMLSTLFLTNDDITFPPQLKTQICISSCNLVFRFEKKKNDELWYLMIKKNFKLVQNIDKKFRVHLIGRSHLLFILMWRLFNLCEQNRFHEIPSFMSVKSMLTRYYFHRLLPKDPFIHRFLSIRD